MRYPIWKKDDFFEPIGEGRIDMDATVVELNTICPLTTEFNWQKPPVGQVNDIRLEDGEITGEVVFFDLLFGDRDMREMGLRLGGYYAAAVRNDTGDRVVSCVLKGVSIMLEDQAPGFQKKNTVL